MRYDSAKLLLTVDLIGTFVFAVEGATAAIQGELDLLGLMVLSFATALAGGIIRDLLIGAIPPGAIRDWRYPAVAFLAGATVFLWHNYVSRVPQSFLVVVDAAGLVALRRRRSSQGARLWNPSFPGGTDGRHYRRGRRHGARSLLARVPTVLRSDIYAVAALAGSGSHGRWAQRRTRSHPDDLRRRDHLFRPAPGRGMAALEPAQGRASMSMKIEERQD